MIEYLADAFKDFVSDEVTPPHGGFWGFLPHINLRVA